MSYIVKQKAENGRICVHLAENHYRSDLKQDRQTRRHLGVLDKPKKENGREVRSSIDAETSDGISG